MYDMWKRGITQQLIFTADFVSFIEKVKALHSKGGSLIWRDGVGMFVAPDPEDLVSLKFDIETFTVIGYRDSSQREQ